MVVVAVARERRSEGVEIAEAAVIEEALVAQASVIRDSEDQGSATLDSGDQGSVIRDSADQASEGLEGRALEGTSTTSVRIATVVGRRRGRKVKRRKSRRWSR
jgi:hypothetical protein